METAEEQKRYLGLLDFAEPAHLLRLSTAWDQLLRLLISVFSLQGAIDGAYKKEQEREN